MKKFYLLFLFIPFAFSTAFAQHRADSLKLYPNPVTTFFSVEDTGKTVRKIEIYSIIGRKERELNTGFQKIDVSDLPKGIYMVKIYTDDAYVVKKMVKTASH